jgi:hypothetical protein
MILRVSVITFLIVATITVNIGIVMTSPSLALSISPVGAKTNNSNVANKSSPSSPLHSSLPPVDIRFDTNTKIKDIIALHNQGIPFDKYIERISQDMKNDTTSVGQIRAWNFIESLVRINADICSLQQSQQQKQQHQPVKANDIQGIVTMMSDNRAEMLKVAPLPSKNVCDAKMSFAYEVCQGDPTISECKNSTQSASKAINNYIKTNNLHDGTQTDSLAYKELQTISATLNHGQGDNTSSDIVHH